MLCHKGSKSKTRSTTKYCKSCRVKRIIDTSGRCLRCSFNTKLQAENKKRIGSKN